MSNSKNMTLEEKLVQNIKDTHLAALIDDEDSITSLTKRALHEAIYKDRTVPSKSGYGQDTIGSPVVEAARELATKALNAVFEEEYKKIMDTPEIRKAIQEAIILLIPNAVQGYAAFITHNMQADMQNAAAKKIVEAFSQSGMMVPPISYTEKRVV